jgi:acyl-coenzyme A thioesterase PaaI-like protein
MKIPETSLPESTRQKHLEITDLIRQLNYHCTTINTDDSVMDELIAHSKSLLAHFQQYDGEKLREHFTPLGAIDRGEGIQPYSPFGGFHNPVSPPIHYSLQDDKIIGECHFDITHEGPHGCVHGGVIAGVYDCILAAAMINHKMGGPTVKLDITYKAPSLLRKPLRFEGWLDKVVGRKVFLMGRCYQGDALVSSAQAIFINNHKRDEHA